MDLIYNIIISPLEYIIENLYVFFYYINEINLTGTLFFISMCVTLMCLPFYLRAEEISKEEDKKLLRIKPYVDKIKRNFKGDEQFFMLKTLYRQHNYNPVMSLRNSFSLLLQIPFFIVAYKFFSTNQFSIYSWGLINDLSYELSNIIGLKIRVLPILMTLINVISCEMYVKSSNIKARLQPYGLALFFLIILYDSPQTLVLYWTFNNFFYLLKNLFLKDNPKFFLLSLLTLGIIVYYSCSYYYNLEIIYFIIHITLYVIVPALIIYFIYKYVKNNYDNVANALKISTDLPTLKMILLPCIGLILLQGLIIPINLFSSDLSLFILEFYNTKNLLSVILKNIYSFVGLYLFWGIITFFIVKKEYRVYYTIALLSLYLFSLFNYLNVNSDLGKLDTNLYFSNNTAINSFFGSNFSQISNGLLFLMILCLLLFLLKKTLIKPIVFFMFSLILTETVVSGIYLHKFINKAYLIENIQKTENQFANTSINLSKNGKNVIMIFLDAFIGGFMPIILEEKPELKNTYSGFTFYPNTVTFYTGTVLGYPPCVGGYEYTPTIMRKLKGNAFYKKWLEASLMLLTLFKSNDYISTVVDPVGNFDINLNFGFNKSFSDIYKSKGINYIKMAGKYNEFFKFQKKELKDKDTLKIIQKKIYMYSFFNISANACKATIYDNGHYLISEQRDKNKDFYNTDNYFISNYSSLSYLKNVTKAVSTSQNTFTLINNELSHAAHFLQYPNYEYSSNEVTNTGPNRFVDDESFKSYHCAMASIMLVGNFLEYLKENGLYDNSRIIIFADHGKENITIPNYTKFQNENVVPYNPLLMFKDFNHKYELKSDNIFMTNADIPSLATNELINNAKNPFTNKIIYNIDNKNNGVDIFIGLDYFNMSHFDSNKIVITNSENYKRVNNDIFDETNWKDVKNSENK